MGGLEVNWAFIIYNNLSKQQASFIPYGVFFYSYFQKKFALIYLVKPMSLDPLNYLIMPLFLE